MDELTRPNFAKFKLRLDSSLTDDIHRKFIGYYFPDTRSIAIFEVRTIVQTVKFLPIFREATYRKNDGSTYFLEDLEVGHKLVLGALETERDGRAVKAFVITEMDDSRITAVAVIDDQMRTSIRMGQSIRGDVDALHRRFRNRFPMDVIKRLGVVFKVSEEHGQRRANAAELFTACQALEVDCTRQDIQDIVEVLDTNRDGLLSYEEFMQICRGPISEARQQCIRQAFQKVDYNRNGIVTPQEMLMFYNPSLDPQVLNGTKTAEGLCREFIRQFDRNDNGMITFQEFEDFYNGVSATIKSDQEFVGMMQRLWNLDHQNPNGITFH